jgi:LmbE family N-acetylglucosaminyl deacetylase
MLLDCDTLPVRNVLVVVPHPDDESLGCGGLIASLAVTGRLFHTVFVTDGGASHPGSREWPRHRVAAQREKEAAAALAHLGIGTIHEHSSGFVMQQCLSSSRPIGVSRWQTCR